MEPKFALESTPGLGHQCINNQSLKASILEATETSELVCSMSSTAEYQTDRSLGSPQNHIYGERYRTASDLG
jgi:hypothetical protein